MNRHPNGESDGIGVGVKVEAGDPSLEGECDEESIDPAVRTIPELKADITGALARPERAQRVYIERR